MKNPIIVCLCGSTKFYDDFQEWNYVFTLAGKIVLSIGCNIKSDEGLKLEDYQKEELDQLHLRKIDLADEVFVINKNDYIGESTSKEIIYALKKNKIVNFLQSTDFIDKLECIKKMKVAALFYCKFEQFLLVGKYSDQVVVKQNEIGMMYNCSIIFNPNPRE